MQRKVLSVGHANFAELKTVKEDIPRLEATLLNDYIQTEMSYIVDRAKYSDIFHLYEFKPNRLIVDPLDLFLRFFMVEQIWGITTLNMIF